MARRYGLHALRRTRTPALDQRFAERIPSRLVADVGVGPLAFVLWNALTIWWIWYATPVGPVAATVASTFLNLIAFMLFHTVSKRAHKALAYVTLVTAWITTEYWYTVGDFSWPWLILGNGFSHAVWMVQWYEYTGVFGGSLWVLVVNILLFEAWKERRNPRKWGAAAAALILPMGVSLAVSAGWKQPDEGTVRVSIIQPNVDCYDKFHGDAERQEQNILDLLGQVPDDAQFILLPETAVPGYYVEPALSDFPWSSDEAGVFWLQLGSGESPAAGASRNRPPRPLLERVLRCLQHGRGTRLRWPHATAPQRPAGHRRRKHPDVGLRRLAFPGHRSGRCRRADRKRNPRIGLRARRREVGFVCGSFCSAAGAALEVAAGAVVVVVAVLSAAGAKLFFAIILNTPF